jgi:NADH-quinone oxidoreductase subunit F
VGFLLPSTAGASPASIRAGEAPKSESLAEYQARGGYQGLFRALRMDPAAIVEEVEASDLRGRGGAGFPTGRKWRLVRAAEGGDRYLVVNGAEGEPGSVKDRRLMAAAPHAVLEGLLIAARALGAAEVPFYVNDQFADAVSALGQALSEVAALDPAVAALADRVRLVPETHVYIAGEETALLNVLMGRPAQPWHKPPYPSDRGYRDAPTAVNNVETLAAVAALFQHDARWFAANRPALFSVSGDVVHPGVYERPLGYSLGQLLAEAGGPPAGEAFSAVLPGGYSMPPLFGPDWNIPLDPDALRGAGTGLGASIIVVATNRTLGAVAHDILQFFARESCGKCPVCVKGTQHLAEALLPAAQGAITASQLSDVVALAQKYRKKGICSFLDSAAHVAEAMAPRLSAP